MTMDDGDRYQNAIERVINDPAQAAHLVEHIWENNLLDDETIGQIVGVGTFDEWLENDRGNIADRMHDEMRDDAWKGRR